jgi:hypothetical protein
MRIRKQRDENDSGSGNGDAAVRYHYGGSVGSPLHEHLTAVRPV